ncbi:MAG: hypothetical protein AMXMBFR7_28530 [Planctomycetota bacterium]
MWTETDDRYWIEAETRVLGSLVELSGRGFVLDSWPLRRGWTDDPRIRVRPGLAEGLERAREALPAGFNFRIVDGWRPWSIQEKAAEDALQQIRKAHPDWTEERIQQRRRELAPLSRIVCGFDSHRYGGAVDLGVLDEKGQRLDMGVPIDHFTGPECALLWFELKADLTEAERVAREHRRILIRAMGAGGFQPYLAEWWHWSMRKDVGPG